MWFSARLVVPEHGASGTGIDRYCAELLAGLNIHGVDTTVAGFRYLPGAACRPVLKAIPVGVEGVKTNNAITHFTRIGGASLLLFRQISNPVVTIHDLGALLCNDDRSMGTSVDRLLLRLSLEGVRRARRVIAVSQFTRSCVISSLRISPDRVDAIYHGVDLTQFHRVPGARQCIARQLKISLPDDTPIVLSVGSDQPRKGLHYLARSIAALHQQGTKVHWIKVGSPLYAPGREALRSEIEKLGIAHFVSFVDTVSDADLPLFYSAADIFVQSSVWEGFGLPVLEAMACGVPVVSTSAASLPEVAGNAAVLVEPRRPDAIASAISRLFAQPRLSREYVRRGLDNVTRFTWEKTVHETLLTYGQASSETVPLRRDVASAGGSQ